MRFQKIFRNHCFLMVLISSLTIINCYSQRVRFRINPGTVAEIDFGRTRSHQTFVDAFNAGRFDDATIEFPTNSSELVTSTTIQNFNFLNRQLLQEFKAAADGPGFTVLEPGNIGPSITSFGRLNGILEVRRQISVNANSRSFNRNLESLSGGAKVLTGVGAGGFGVLTAYLTFAPEPVITKLGAGGSAAIGGALFGLSTITGHIESHFKGLTSSQLNAAKDLALGSYYPGIANFLGLEAQINGGTVIKIQRSNINDFHFDAEKTNRLLLNDLPDGEEGFLIGFAGDDLLLSQDGELEDASLPIYYSERTDFFALDNTTEDVTLVSTSFSADFFPLIESLGEELLRDFELTAFDGDLISPFDGVDFTNVELAGLDFDDVSEQVHFILQGDRVSSSTPTNLRQRSAFLKKIFLQALAVPKEDHFVSLEKDVNGNGVAIATDGFKRTDMAPIFFEADEELKFEFLDAFYNRPGQPAILQKWIDLLTDSDEDRRTFYRMFEAGKSNILTTLPQIGIRFVIVPQVPPLGNRSGGKLFLRDAQLGLFATIENLNLVFRADNGQPLVFQGNEFSYIQSNFSQFGTWLANRLALARNDVLNRVRTSSKPEFERLRSIYSTIIAALWYKEHGNVSESLQGLIDSNNFSSAYTGKAFAVGTSFNQNFYNNKADQFLGNHADIEVQVDHPDDNRRLSGTIPGVAIRGGVNVENISYGSINSNGLSSVQNVILNDVPGTDFDAQNHVNGGFVDYRLPELVASAIQVLDDDNMRELQPSVFRVYILNTGESIARNVEIEVYIDEPGKAKRRIVHEMIDEIAATSNYILNSSFKPMASGNTEIELIVNGSRIVQEGSFGNNSFKKSFEVGPYECAEIIGLFSPTDGDDYHVYAEKIVSAEEFVVDNTSSVFLDATNEISFEDGTHIKAGNEMHAKLVSSCAQLRNAASGVIENRISRVALSNSVKEQKLQSEINRLLEEKQERYARTENNDTPEVERIRAVMQSIVSGDFVTNTDPITDLDFRLQPLSDLTLVGNSPSVDNWSVYPVPVVDKVSTVLQMNKTREGVSFDLLDLKGRLVKQLNRGVSLSVGVQKVELDMSEVDQAVYILRVNLGGGEILTKMVIKK